MLLDLSLPLGTSFFKAGLTFILSSLLPKCVATFTGEEMSSNPAPNAGDRVEALHEASGEWLPGTVSRVDDACVDIDNDSGGSEAAVLHARLRALKSSEPPSEEGPSSEPLKSGGEEDAAMSEDPSSAAPASAATLKSLSTAEAPTEAASEPSAATMAQAVASVTSTSTNPPATASMDVDATPPAPAPAQTDNTSAPLPAALMEVLKLQKEVSRPDATTHRSGAEGAGHHAKRCPGLMLALVWNRFWRAK